MPSIVSQCNLSLSLHGQPAGSVAARYGRTRRSMVYAGQHSVKKDSVENFAKSTVVPELILPVGITVRRKNWNRDRVWRGLL